MMQREITLPANAIDMLAGRHEAGLLNQDITAAYWMYDSDSGIALYLLKRIHETFARLADELGYTITPKDQPTEDARAMLAVEAEAAE